MVGRLVMAMAVCATALGGCSSPAEPELLTAFQAISVALAAAPEALFVGVYGVEGPQPDRDPGFLAFRSDGANDGELGDGRISQWTIALDGPAGHEEILVGAAGILDRRTTAPRERPEFLYDQAVWIDVFRRLDSDDAARAALGDGELQRRKAAGGGFTYSYSPYRQDDPASEAGGPWAGIDGRDLGMVGRTNHGSDWHVVHLDPTWSGGQAPRAHEVLVAPDGTIDATATFLPLRLREAYDELVFEESLASEGGRPGVHTYQFEVGQGAILMRGSMHPRAYLDLPGHPQQDRASMRLLRPDGGVAYEGPGQDRRETWSTEDVPAGTWTIEVWHALDVPARVFLRGHLRIAEPIQPGEVDP